MQYYLYKGHIVWCWNCPKHQHFICSYSIIINTWYNQLCINVVVRSVIGLNGISDRIIIVKIFSIPFNLSIIQVYAPTSASSEEEIVAFYNDLDDAYKQCGSQEMVVVMGDLNAKVGTEQDPQKVVV